MKLYANVVGKFTVERELHDDVRDKVRESTQEAVNQRMNRTTQLIQPSDIQPNSKKRKDPRPSSMFHKPIRHSGSKEGSTPLRTRMVHSLAIADRTEEEGNNTKPEAPKRGVSSQEVREKKAKQKPNPKAEIMMKDESLKANSRSSQAGIRDAETTQTKKIQSTSRESLTTGRNQGSLSTKSVKYETKRGDGETSHVASTKPQNARSSVQDDGSSRKLPAGDREGRNLPLEVVRRRHDKGPEPSDSEREGRYLQSNVDKARTAAREERSLSLPSKRKTTNRDDSEYIDAKSLPQKRRKTETSAIHNTSLPRDEKPAGSLTVDKSNVEPRARMNTTTRDLPDLPPIKKEKESAGLPPKPQHHPKAKVPLNMASSSHPPPSNDEGVKSRHGSTKIRRRSPIYTSSEDEELPTSNRVSYSSSLATCSTLSNSQLPSNNSGSRTTSRSLLSRSTGTDHAALRTRYSTVYVEYLASLRELITQREMVSQMLKISDTGSVGSATDSDGEVELLQPEELARLAADHKKRHEELVSIQQMFATSTRA